MYYSQCCRENSGRHKKRGRSKNKRMIRLKSLEMKTKSKG
jgi:hypothetical protein